MELPSPESKLRYIIHLSDIHIRTGDFEQARYDEYAFVFKNLAKTIKLLIKNIKEFKDSFVVIITGDIFESKSRIESAGIRLFNMFMSSLTRYAPVYIIEGNHDYRQDQPDIDLLSSFLHDYPDDNVYYLNKTGIYNLDNKDNNISFGLVTIKDYTMPRLQTARGHTDKLPEFPSPVDGKLNIALFHGTITTSTFQNYYEATEGFPIDWFTGYNIGLFGDVHLQQINNAKQSNDNPNTYNYPIKKHEITWAYSGSLIQQNYGEQIQPHGFLLWDLESKLITSYNIDNCCGFIYIKYNYEDNKFQCGNSGNWELLQNILQSNLQKIYIKLRGKTDDEIISKLNEILSKSGKECRITSSLLNDALENTIDSYSNSNNNLIKQTNNSATEKNINNLVIELKNNSSKPIIEAFKNTISYDDPLMWINYLKKQFKNIDLINNSKIIKELDLDADNINELITKWIMNPETLTIPVEIVIPTLVEKAESRNKKIIKIIEKLQVNSDKTKERKYIKLMYITWSWILCYKEDNWFDFTNIYSKICTINAKNDFGKSSFLEIICLALFGKSIPSRTNKDNPTSVICYQKPTNKIASIELKFMYSNDDNNDNDTIYTLYRVFEKSKAKTTCNKINKLFKLTKNGGQQEIKSGIVAVNQWIEEHVGDLDSFLLSCMLTQKTDRDFFLLTKKEQMDLLDNSLKLDSIHAFREALKQITLAYKALIDQTNAIYEHNMENTIPIDEKQIEDNNEQCNILSSSISDLEKDLLKIIVDENISNNDKNRNIEEICNLMEKYELQIKELKLQKKENTLSTDILAKIKVEIENFNFSNVNYRKNNDLEELKILEKLDKQKPDKTFENELNELKNINENNYNSVMNKIKQINSKFSPQVYEQCINNINEKYKQLSLLKELCSQHPLQDKKIMEQLTKQLILDKSKLTNKEFFNFEKSTIKKAFSDLKNIRDLLKQLKILSTNDHVQTILVTNKEIQQKYLAYSAKFNNNQLIDNDLNELDQLSKYITPNEECQTCKLKNDIHSLIVNYKKYKLNDDTIKHNQLIKELENYNNPLIASKIIKTKAELIDKTDFKSLMDDISFCNDNIEKWRQYEETIRSTELNEYQEQAHKDLSEYKILINFKKELTELENEKYKIERKRKCLENKKLYNEWVEWNENIRKLRNKIQKDEVLYIEHLMNIDNNINKYTKLLETYKLLKTNIENINKRELITKKIMSKKDKLKTLERENDKLIMDFKSYKKITKENKQIEKSRMALIKSNFLIEKIVEYFAEYKNWVYKDNIIPLLLEKINQIASLNAQLIDFGNQSIYKLTADVEAEYINWYIDDGQNKVVVEKAGGFRQFIFGLAFRIALSFMGVSGAWCKHLFIDEGFVSADSYNLEKIPEFINNLLSIYTSIVLVSHLDTIKACGTINANIIRFPENLSQLQFGNKIQIKKIDTKKITKNKKEFIDRDNTDDDLSSSDNADDTNNDNEKDDSEQIEFIKKLKKQIEQLPDGDEKRKIITRIKDLENDIK